jgi:hypothetical protein
MNIKFEKMSMAARSRSVVPGELPASRAATHVPKGTSTIRRNENQARAGRVPVLMPDPLPG